ncbi:hypothetical protein [Actinomadura rubrisoli]|nr:hypothetical protein [Actinomadura rubrisoli]
MASTVRTWTSAHRIAPTALGTDEDGATMYLVTAGNEHADVIGHC